MIRWHGLLLFAAVGVSGCRVATAVEATPPATAAKDIVLAADTTLVSARVAAGATLASILRAENIVAADIADLVLRAGAVFDLRKIRSAQRYRLEKTVKNTVRRLEYEIDGDRFLQIVRSPDDVLVADVVAIPKTGREQIVRGEIDAHHPSLASAMDAAGETIDLTLALADVFGGDIDFSTDLRRGDRFELTVEKRFREGGEFAGYGPILAAQFENAGRTVRAVRFAPEDGLPGYYDERGVSMRRFFLASPLKFQPVVTSAFSRSRFHPILREYRAHLGVDYRAPEGAPVVAVADGFVEAAGPSGGSGLMVHLRHPNGFETEYLHLSAIAIRAGSRVRQGELIGRVGATGLATASHLDYRVKRNGLFVNPVAVHRSMPPPDPIPPSQTAVFIAARDRALARLAGSDAGVGDSNAGVK